MRHDGLWRASRAAVCAPRVSWRPGQPPLCASDQLRFAHPVGRLARAKPDNQPPAQSPLTQRGASACPSLRDRGASGSCATVRHRLLSPAATPALASTRRLRMLAGRPGAERQQAGSESRSATLRPRGSLDGDLAVHHTPDEGRRNGAFMDRSWARESRREAGSELELSACFAIRQQPCRQTQ